MLKEIVKNGQMIFFINCAFQTVLGKSNRIKRLAVFLPVKRSHKTGRSGLVTESLIGFKYDMHKIAALAFLKPEDVLKICHWICTMNINLFLIILKKPTLVFFMRAFFNVIFIGHLRLGENHCLLSICFIEQVNH